MILKASEIRLIGIFLVLTGFMAHAQMEYTTSVNTYVLMHLNDKNDLKVEGQGEKAEARLFGDASIVEAGWFKGALNPGNDGGILIQTDKPFNPPHGYATLEAWIYLKSYPKKRGYIIDKVYECSNSKVQNNKPENGAVGLSMFIDEKGRVGNEITSLYYGPAHKVVCYSPDGFKVPLEKWTHVVVCNAGWPVRKYSMYVNRKKVLKKPHEYQHRIFHNTEKENACGKIIVGNNVDHNAAFPGLIDEVRILGSNLVLSEAEDMSWLDPLSKRPLERKGKYFLPDTEERIYVSCDEEGKYQAYDKARFYPVFEKGGRLVPGVRGNAWSGNLTLNGKGILDGREGSLEFWMMPENWNNRSTRNLKLIGLGSKPVANIYIFNCVHELRPLSFYFKNDEGQIMFLDFGAKPIDENIWKHIVLTWNGTSYKSYVNGKMVSEKQFRGIENMLNATRENVFFKGKAVSEGENKGKSSRFDEIYIYGKALTATEVKNAYYRYRDPEKLVKALPYDVKFKNYPSSGKIMVDIDFLKGIRPSVLKIVVSQNGNKISEKTIEVSDPQEKIACFCPVDKVAVGAYNARLDFIGEGGKILESVNHEFKKLETPWLHNKLGIPEKVPEPWIPLEKTGNYKLKTLMSEYDFSKGLLAQVVTNSGKTLAAPIMFQGVVDGKTLEFNEKTSLRVNENGLDAVLEKELNSPELIINVKGLVDFDGFIKYQIRLCPAADSVELDSLVLKIPYLADQALDYYVLGEHMDHISGETPEKQGMFWNSLEGRLFKRHELAEYGAMKRPRKSMTYGNFYAYAWLGNNKRGICYMADNDSGWVQNENKAALVLSRDGKTVYMVLNLVGAPVTITKENPREITLALMATPSKRPAKGWRHWNTSSFYPLEAAGRVKNEDIFYAPYPVDYSASKAFMDGVWQSGKIPLPYMDFYGSDGRMEPAEYFRWEWWPGITDEDFPGKPQLYMSNYNSGSLTDWYVYNINKWVDQCGINGLYVDNHYLTPLAHPVTGPGYEHEKGKTQPGYELFAMREFFKRVYCLMEAKGKTHPYLMVHMTHSMIAPTMSFADIAYEGEDHYIYGEKESGVPRVNSQQEKAEIPDHIELWPNHVVRVIDEPHTWGVATYWLPAVRGAENKWQLERSRDEYIRAWYTQLFLHDMRGSISKDKEMMKVFSDFLNNDPDVRFTLYRDNKAFSADNPENVYISYYQKGKDVLAVFGNHRETPAELEVTVNSAILGIPAEFQCIDAESLEKLKVTEGRFKLTVKPRNYRLILLKASDKSSSNRTKTD